MFLFQAALICAIAVLILWKGSQRLGQLSPDVTIRVMRCFTWLLVAVIPIVSLTHLLLNYKGDHTNPIDSPYVISFVVFPLLGFLVWHLIGMVVFFAMVIHLIRNDVSCLPDDLASRSRMTQFIKRRILLLYFCTTSFRTAGLSAINDYMDRKKH